MPYRRVVSDVDDDREAVFAALNRPRIVEALGLLSLPGLIDLLDEVLRSRTITHDGGDEERIVLAVAAWYPPRAKQEGSDEAYLAALGLPDLGPNDRYYPSGFCQMGTCRTCRTEIVSDVKRVLCPVCRTPRSLT
jgi:hypothetical protein